MFTFRENDNVIDHNFLAELSLTHALICREGGSIILKIGLVGKITYCVGRSTLVSCLEKEGDGGRQIARVPKNHQIISK